MAGYTETIEHWIDEQEYRELQPSIFEKIQHSTGGKEIKFNRVEIDDELGLELIPEKPSIFTKYGVQCDPTKNSFHKSLYDQYMRRGSLSEKQINALRKTY
jgi:hypothetical protein